MLPIETISAFFIASILLAMAPGPDNVFVLTQSALHGRFRTNCIDLYRLDMARQVRGHLSRVRVHNPRIVGR